jgi:hypothetical protein
LEILIVAPPQGVEYEVAQEYNMRNQAGALSGKLVKYPIGCKGASYGCRLVP